MATPPTGYFRRLRKLWRDTRATTTVTLLLAAYAAWMGMLLGVVNAHSTTGDDRVLPLVAWGVLYFVASSALILGLLFALDNKVRIYMHGYATLIFVGWALVTDIEAPTVFAQPGYTFAAIICGLVPFIAEFVDRRYGLKPSTIESVLQLHAEDNSIGNMSRKLQWEWDEERHAWVTVIGGVVAAVGDGDDLTLNFTGDDGA